MATDSDARSDVRSDVRSGGATPRQELLVTVLLVVAAVATSWSSYEAARWHGEQALATSRTSAIRIDAARASSMASAQTEVDVATFIAWAEADQRGDEELTHFFVERFRPEFARAFDAWHSADPFTTSGAPETPFAMPEYQLEARTEAERLDAAAAASAADVERDIQRASNYVLSVVLYAVVLFFAGMSTKLAGRRVRTTTIAIGFLVMTATIMWVTTFPISLAV